MRERARRRTSLLQFAIMASTAILPVLLAVLLTVASSREADVLAPSRVSDRHVSVRHVAALKTFEHAIVRRDRIATALPVAQTLAEQVPQCRGAWEGAGGMLDRMRRFVTRAPLRGTSPATRMAAQLKDIDDALRDFSNGENRRVTDAVGFDAAAWLDAVNAALQSPVETPEYPGRRFTLQCADVADAVAALARSNGRMLASLAWRGTVVDRVTARWRPEQFVEISARDIARANPWSGIPGCIYLDARARDAEPATFYLGGIRGLDDRLCQREDMRGIADEHGHAPPAFRLAGEPTPDMPIDDERWRVPPSLGTLLQPLETLHRPGGALYRLYTAEGDDTTAAPARSHRGPNRIDIGGAPVDVGLSINVTIDPSLQGLAQRIAACYTGRDDVCGALGVVRREDAGHVLGYRLLEHAQVRMAAVAVIDVESGRIEALAGAMSPCTRHEYDGPGRAAQCDKRLPYPIRYRPDALQNAAVFHDAMPGSTIKPIMAAAFLTDGADGARLLSSERADIARSPTAVPTTEMLRGQLARSDSIRFLDRMFCADKGFAAGCARPREIQAMTPAFGWNAGCANPDESCGKRDLLFGRTVDAPGEDDGARTPAFDIAYGRLLAEPVDGKLAAFRLRSDFALDPTKLQQCAAGADGRRHTPDDWGKCRREVVDVVSEGWGQGHARASALGVAGMMAALAAAANGQTEIRAPHLVEALRGAGTAPAAGTPSTPLRVDLADVRSNRIPREVAEVIVSGLSFSHRAGTARLACEQVFDASVCTQMDWIAGKTGTPSFRNDDRSLSELARLCGADAATIGKSRRDRDICGPLRPYKWYVATYRADPKDPRWTKAIAVLTERNWLADTGRVHGAGDRGPNPAAEIAMQIAGRHVGAIAWNGR